jgi:hypothetical protein
MLGRTTSTAARESVGFTPTTSRWASRRRGDIAETR